MRAKVRDTSIKWHVLWKVAIASPQLAISAKFFAAITARHGDSTYSGGEQIGWAGPLAAGLSVGLSRKSADDLFLMVLLLLHCLSVSRVLHLRAHLFASQIATSNNAKKSTMSRQRLSDCYTVRMHQ